MKTESRTLLTIASSLIGSASADETLIPEEAQALIGINGGILLLLEPLPVALFPPPAEDVGTLKARIVQLEQGMWSIYADIATYGGDTRDVRSVIKSVRATVRKATEPTMLPAIPNPEPVTPLVLEVGKRYVNRNGDITNELELNHPDSKQAFLDPRARRTYHANGRYRIYGDECTLDLVSEYDEPDIRQRVSDLADQLEAEACVAYNERGQIARRLREVLA